MAQNELSVQDALVLSQLIGLVRSGAASTRPALESSTGLGRRIVTDRISDALALGVLEEGDLGPSLGGRAPRTVRLRADAGVILSASLGALECVTGISTADGTLLASEHLELDVADGPDAVLPIIDASFGRLLRKHGNRRPLWGIGIGVPGPVDVTTGRPVAPPIMPGWDGADLRGWFLARHGVPVFVDNDSNLAALGEWYQGTPRDGRDLLYVKVGSGIGSGLVSRGQLHRGDRGAAGDIGHVRVTDEPILCRCGRTGCLEAVAGGWALVRTLTERAGESPFMRERLAARGYLVPQDVADAIAERDQLTEGILAASATVIGDAVASVVNFANPGTLVLGGGVLRTGELFPRIFAERVRDSAIELASRYLDIRTASLDFREGAIGGALLVVERLFAPTALPLWISAGSPVGFHEELHAA